MKKYDLILVAMYIIVAVVIVNDVKCWLRTKGITSAESIALTENQAIKAVVISNSTAEVEIYALSVDTPDGTAWAIRGSVENDYFANITIQNDTLRIDGIEPDGLRGVIKLSDSVHLEIINSPNVKRLTDEEFAEKAIKNPEKYDF
ncbi:MAG: hypothetical protein SNI51_03760 [Rikenellaceae bacterium]